MCVVVKYYSLIIHIVYTVPLYIYIYILETAMSFKCHFDYIHDTW